MYEKLKKILFGEIELNAEEVIGLSDYLADNPEISGNEYNSSKKIAELLRKHDFQTEQPFVGLDTAFFAKAGEENYQRKIALLTEYDALPSIGHACGHCASGAISILAGIALSKIQKELNANVHVIGTPDEETNGAKCLIATKGIFDDYDIAMMIHMGDKNLSTSNLLAMDSYQYTFHGQPSHAAAAPWLGKNALNGVQLMLHAMDMLRQHVKPDVRIHSIIDYGGEAPNIVPKKASAIVYIRADEREYLNTVIKMVDDCAKGAAIATQTTFDKVKTAYPYDNLKQNETGRLVVEESFKEVGLTLSPPSKLSGSSDAGNVSMRCPTFHPTIAVSDKELPVHTVEFAQAMKTDSTHRAIADGAKIIVLQMLKLFTNEDLLCKLKEDFNK